MLLILCQLTEEPESSSSGTPEMHPAPHQSAGGIVCGTDAGGWVGAPISWAEAADFRANRSQVRRPWRMVCVYRRRPPSMPDHGSAEGVMLPSQLCVRGLGSCAPGGWLLGAGRESSSKNSTTVPHAPEQISAPCELVLDCHISK